MTSPIRATLLTALALLGGAAPALAQAAGGGGTTAVYRRCESCADSLRKVFVIKQTERAKLEKRMRELETKLNSDDLGATERATLSEELANVALRLADVGTRFAVEFAPRMHELAPVIDAQVRRELAETRAAMMRVQPRDVLRNFAPKGWLGINVNGHPQEIRVQDGELFLRFAEYPEVVSVDPNSPAQKAGVRTGDLLMAYDGKDVRNSLAMGSILVPDRQVSVRVRRGGESRDLRMTVAPAPRHYAGRLSNQVAPMPPAEPLVAARAMSVPRARRPLAATEVVVTGPDVDLVRTPGGFAYSTIVGDAFVGAQLERLTEEMAEVVKVSRGVLVVKLFPGTPAAQSGLKPLDVIVRAADREVTTPTALREVVRVLRNGSGPEEVVLDVVRGGAKRKVTVKWE